MLDEMNTKLDGGYRHVLRLAGPMILSTGSMSVMRFMDRMFAAWYSQDSLAASLPAGIASFVPLAFFTGTAGYVSTFVAQYHGASREHRIGPAVWQGIYLSLVAMVLMWGLYPLAEPIMNAGRHAEPVRVLEINYFRILVLGGGFVVLNAVLNGFYIGRGRMYTVMAVSLAANTVNVVLNYCWIFGHWGFPRWGLVGAGWATVSSQGLTMVILATLFLSQKNRQDFGTASNIGFDKKLFKRLLYYGIPNGLNFCIDVTAFTFFVFFVGRIGQTEGATNNAVFSINMLAFMPMFGLAIATSTLVGQCLGRKRPDLAQRATGKSLRIVMVYMGLIATVFILLPKPLLRLFTARDGTTDPTEMLELGKMLLVFVAIYSLFRGVVFVYSAALKGAGDTRFVLVLTGTLAWGVMVLPVYIGIKYFNGGIRMAFTFLTIYVISLACGFYLRYRGGKWKKMRVIEPEEIKPIGIAEGPLVET
ncbi:MAG: MATE family efflux transporter [Actinobacteria bacterium]|nr:MATE family efflux transporter [Actinomycetota bacterium]